MKNSAFLVCLAAVILTGITGCSKKESFSDIPAIDFVSFINAYDTGQFAKSGILSISFQDGNGDIGLSDSDTLSPYQRNGSYYYNLVITYFEMQKGVFKQVDLAIPFSARIPPLSPDDPNKAIKGTITDTLLLNPHPVYDTIKFEVFIYDRALNKSNVVTTPAIILRKN
jgi:hypothetical protein